MDNIRFICFLNYFLQRYCIDYEKNLQSEWHASFPQTKYEHQLPTEEGTYEIIKYRLQNWAGG